MSFPFGISLLIISFGMGLASSVNNTIFSAEASSVMVQELADGTVDTADFMRRIKDSIQTL